MRLRSSYRASAAPLVLWLGGCTNAVVADRPMRMGDKPAEQSMIPPIRNHAELIKDFDKTLTEAERKAVVTDLQKDRERQARLR
jgi:hypothetical protein